VRQAKPGKGEWIDLKPFGCCRYPCWSIAPFIWCAATIAEAVGHGREFDVIQSSSHEESETTSKKLSVDAARYENSARTLYWIPLSGQIAADGQLSAIILCPDGNNLVVGLLDGDQTESLPGDTVSYDSTLSERRVKLAS
jgi:hypothetical protein